MEEYRSNVEVLEGSIFRYIFKKSIFHDKYYNVKDIV